MTLPALKPKHSSASCRIVLAAALFLACAARAQSTLPLLWQASADSDRVNTLNFTPDGNTLVTGSSDRLINVWDASSGELLKTLDSNAPYVHASSIECLAINPANPIQVATVSSNIEHLWNLSTGAETSLSPRPGNWMVWCAFSPDGKWLATASFNATIRLWSLSGDSASLYKVFQASTLQRTCAFSPDGRWLASAGGDRAVTIRDTSDWSVVAVMQGHTNDIYDMVFSPDSTMLATGGYDNTARLWNVGSWTSNAVFGGYGPVYGVAFTSDSKTLAYTDGEGYHIFLADTQTGQILQMFDTSDIQCVAFSPQGLLAYGDVNTTVFVSNPDLDVGAPPSIDTQPASGAVNLGASYIFSVTASGPGPLAYQWFENSTPIPDATNSTCAIISATATNAASYYVQVSNPYGSATSDTATLEVLVPPSIGTFAYTNNAFQFSLASAASGSLSIQASSDLLSWTTLFTTNDLSSPLTWSDPAATNYPVRFYRVMLGP